MFPGATVVTTLVCYQHTAHEAAGATGTRHSPRPRFSRRESSPHAPGALRRGSERASEWARRHCCDTAGTLNSALEQRLFSLLGQGDWSPLSQGRPAESLCEATTASTRGSIPPYAIGRPVIPGQPAGLKPESRNAGILMSSIEQEMIDACPGCLLLSPLTIRCVEQCHRFTNVRR